MLGRWFRDWRSAWARYSEFDHFNREEAESIARDVGIPVADLRELATHDPHDADQMPLMMKALHIDPNEVQRADAALYRDMQRLCTMCESHGRCARDLEQGEAKERFREYCRNADTFNALRSCPVDGPHK